MEFFFTADDHFGHGDPKVPRSGILKHTNRPFANIDENDEILIQNWNSVVPRHGGVVCIIGDFAWKNHSRYLQRLNGKKILIKGSHDRMSQPVLDEFNVVRAGVVDIDIDAPSCCNHTISDDALRLFKEVLPDESMVNPGNHLPFCCSHCCPRVWERGHYGVPALFGHSHGRLLTFNLSVDVGVDSGMVYKKLFPCPLEDILAFMVIREQEMRNAGRVIEERGKVIFRQDDVWWALHRNDAPKTHEGV